jgi:aldose 1-epimerase
MAAGCGSEEIREGKMKVTKQLFGKTVQDEAVDLYTLDNGSGMVAKVITYGGILTHLQVPDRRGKAVDVVLGFGTLAAYLKGHPYFGALIGRYGNRIARGRFKLAGKEYQLATNNGANHLHGGDAGFDKKVWQGEAIESPDEVGVRLSYLSKDMEEGYPGNLQVTVTYTINRQQELKIVYHATTDKATPVNLTHHSYFNLNGHGTILDHQLMVAAGHFLPVDAGLIPTGERRSVKQTAMDFTSFQPIGSRIEQVSGGYDHNYILNNHDGSLKEAARVTGPKSGITMTVLTTEPGLQFYSGNFLDGTLKGKGGFPYQKHGGLCLEAQHFPDSPNRPEFPGTILKPGEVYRQTTIYRFDND